MRFGISVIWGHIKVFCFLHTSFLPLSRLRIVEAALAIRNDSFDSILGAGGSSCCTASRPVFSKSRRSAKSGKDGMDNVTVWQNQFCFCNAHFKEERRLTRFITASGAV